MRFLALGAYDMHLLRALIGSLDFRPLLNYLARLVYIILSSFFA